MTVPTGKALAMQLQLLKYNRAPKPPHHIPLTASCKGNLIVSGLAAATTTDLQNIKFAPFAFGMLSAANTPLYVKHDASQIAGECLALNYNANGEVEIQAELRHELAKRCGGFSVGVTVRDFVMDPATGVATVTSAIINEISATDCPANPQCLIKQRHPPCAEAEYYSLVGQAAQVIYKIAEVVAGEVIKAQRQRPKDAAPSSMVHPRKPPTQFAPRRYCDDRAQYPGSNPAGRCQPRQQR